MLWKRISFRIWVVNWEFCGKLGANEEVDMEKKRSKGVTIFGWVFIVFGIIGLLSMLDPQELSQFYGTPLFIFSMLASLATFLCGIFLLKLTPIARKIAILLGILGIISIPFYLKPAIASFDPDEYLDIQRQRILEQIRPEHQQKALEDLEMGMEIGEKVVPVIVIVMFGIPLLLLESLPIIFFTRPKVKEQFK